MPETNIDHVNEWSGEEYNSNSVMQLNTGKARIDSFHFEGNEKVLDLGCGNGATSQYLAKEKVPQGSVHATDLAVHMLEFAKKNNAAPNLKYSSLNVLDLNETEEYDLVTSFWMLHWVPDLKKALENIKRALKPGGRTLLLLSANLKENPLTAITNKHESSEKWKQYGSIDDVGGLPKYPRKEFEDIVVSAGFPLSSLTIDTLEYEFPSKEKFIGGFKVLPIFKHIPSDKLDEYLSDLADLFAKEFPAEGGKIKQPILAATIRATKE